MRHLDGGGKHQEIRSETPRSGDGLTVLSRGSEVGIFNNGIPFADSLGDKS